MEKVKIMIEGTGTVSAGEYGEIVIQGSGKMDGPFTCDNLIVPKHQTNNFGFFQDQVRLP